jgi:cobalt-zinc-cadmium efflux system membrane fusion protein
MTLLPLAAALLLALAGCSESTHSTVPAETEAGEDAAAGEAGHDESEATALVRMDEAELAAAGIRLQTLQPAVLSESLRAPGEVVENAYGATLITPRVEALVVRRHARLGDEVRAGAPLVTLSSVEVADAQADLRIAEQEWRRVSELGREAVAGRRITEARVALDRARATARAYGLPGTAQGHANGQFTLTAPHAGRITEDDFLVGQRIEPGMPLFRLVDESTVWVDATLPSGIAPRIGEGSVATVIADGQRIAGKVLRSAHRTSETTRTASVRIEVPNKGDRLHAGDFVEVRFDAGSAASIDNPALAQLSVPTNALVQLEGDTVVFRRTEDGALAAVPVRKGEVLGDRTVIEEGLEAGDAVVVEGAFAIKSQMLKAQLGEGHGH